MNDLKATVIALARACGFDLVGVTSADDFVADREAALERIREGRMEGLPWYTESRVMRGTSPSELLPGARSVVCLGLSYLGDDWPEYGRPSTSSGRTVAGAGRTVEDAGRTVEDAGRTVEDAGRTDADRGRGVLDSRFRGNDGRFLGNDGDNAGVGRVARYAWVRDYHRVMKRRMREFVRSVERELGAEIAARWYVDDGPMLDRAAANRAGIGWFGKNTNILTPQFGSWVFLGQVITDLVLEPDAPLKKSCGSCVRCIDDCPTGAIVAPYVIDNARCISYLTIENRGPIPRELRPLMQDWVFGCDICQDVCPVNRKARPGVFNTEGTESTEDFMRKGNRSVLSVSSVVDGFLDLVKLLEMSEEEFRSRFAGTSIMRAKWVGMQRNACVALGNLGDAASVPALSRALRAAEPLVRGHAAWALGRIGGPGAEAALVEAGATETDPDVAEEITLARGETTSP